MEDAAAVRYHASCELAGRAFDDITIDVTFGSPELSGADTVRGPELLEFADIHAVEVPAIPLLRHVAEKLHAYTRAYGRSGRPSTRVKDLVDLALIASEAELDAVQLRRQLEATFSSRGTHRLPSELPRPPQDWTIPYGRLAREVGIPERIEQGHAQAAAMLDAVLSGRVADGAWDPRAGVWRAKR